MTAAVKKTGTRLVRWFAEFQRQNRPPYKWYEHDLYCGGPTEPPTIAHPPEQPLSGGFFVSQDGKRGPARRVCAIGFNY